MKVSVRQVVERLNGELLFHGMVKHAYTFQDGLLKTMRAKLAANN